MQDCDWKGSNIVTQHVRNQYGKRNYEGVGTNCVKKQTGNLKNLRREFLVPMSWIRRLV